MCCTCGCVAHQNSRHCKSSPAGHAARLGSTAGAIHPDSPYIPPNLTPSANAMQARGAMPAALPPSDTSSPSPADPQLEARALPGDAPWPSAFGPFPRAALHAQQQPAGSPAEAARALHRHASTPHTAPSDLAAVLALSAPPQPAGVPDWEALPPGASEWLLRAQSLAAAGTRVHVSPSSPHSGAESGSAGGRPAVAFGGAPSAPGIQHSASLLQLLQPQPAPPAAAALRRHFSAPPPGYGAAPLPAAGPAAQPARTEPARPHTYAPPLAPMAPLGDHWRWPRGATDRSGPPTPNSLLGPEAQQPLPVPASDAGASNAGGQAGSHAVVAELLLQALHYLAHHIKLP